MSSHTGKFMNFFRAQIFEMEFLDLNTINSRFLGDLGTIRKGLTQTFFPVGSSSMLKVFIIFNFISLEIVNRPYTSIK